MRTLPLAIVCGLLLSANVTEAEVREVPPPRCQQLALDFAENPDALEADRLKQLQFCINQALAKREATDPPTMLKGTIIEPLTSSENDSLPTPPNLGTKD